jgi:hypothetical protein
MPRETTNKSVRFSLDRARRNLEEIPVIGRFFELGRGDHQTRRMESSLMLRGQRISFRAKRR